MQGKTEYSSQEEMKQERGEKHEVKTENGDGDVVAPQTIQNLNSDSDQSVPEVRLVLLGQTGSGKSTAGNCILGCDAFESHASDGVAVTHKCEKKTSTVAGNQVTVVDTPDWFRSDDSPEMVQHQISTCKALLTPGPHAFLLCVPVNKPAIVELQALEALKVVFGAKAVSHHTLVLFTHVDQLPEGQTLENYIASKRQDLLEVTTRCDDRYHFLERGKEDKDRRKSVEELLEKVESMVRESGVEFYNCPPCQQVETPTRLRQKERTKEEQTEKRASLSSSSSSPMPDHPEDTVNITEESPLSEETELTEEDLREEDLAPASSSFFGGLWNSTVGWIRYLISLVRGTTLLGSIVGLFVGGPLGGMLGSTVGSVATEVGRRKHDVKKKQ